MENAKTMTRKSKMSLGEASQVLNLPKNEFRLDKISEVMPIVMHHPFVCNVAALFFPVTFPPLLSYEMHAAISTVL